jgi:rSAM/selenodomain-associated transferase 2
LVEGKKTRLSVVIPVLNEERTIGATLENLTSLAPEEIIVVDGGSTDRTRDKVTRTQAALTLSDRGRALQMNRGADLARGDVLLFLHADTRLPSTALTDITLALEDPRYVGGRFDVTLDGKSKLLRWVGVMINLRSRLTRVATGDQAIFVHRKVFEEIGGFPNFPLMEDIAFSQRLKKTGKVACLRSQVITSARRWEREGIWKTMLKMWALRLLFLGGVSPLYLKRFYTDAR